MFFFSCKSNVKVIILLFLESAHAFAYVNFDMYICIYMYICNSDMI